MQIELTITTSASCKEVIKVHKTISALSSSISSLVQIGIFLDINSGKTITRSPEPVLSITDRKK